MALNPNIELSQTVAHKPWQETYDDCRIEVETNGGENLREEEPRPPESGWIICINKNLDRAKQDHRAHSWRLREKDKDKWRGLVCMLKRNIEKIEDYLDAMKQVEERSRACYEGTIKMRNEEFVMMMVLDGCFVIKLFWGYSMGFDKLGYTPDDLVFSSSRRIKFINGEVEGFQKIQFKDETLEIPRLVIQDATRSLFLNLVAFEQCHFNCGNNVTSYLFMDNLINSAENVGHLHNCGIMEHWLRSDAEVADLFNQLCKDVVLVGSHSYLSGLSKDVNTYFGNKWNGWIAILELKYFSNPLSIISFIAAFILLGLTLAQTLYGIFGYYRPGS
ncbi:uncharacterized protein LOC104428705 [Eucalyptus grandis]|uniref:uncharacterized protein LOC104428705 n=1 Tax=Eucalyptus grandis TaxID=71139 RepID=UPI00192E9001|nr:uncharacterized protein LOC104428705 [Eucalyptus grandis]